MPYEHLTTRKLIEGILDTDKALVRAQDTLIALSKPGSLPQGQAAKLAYIESTHKLIEALQEESLELSAELERRGPPAS
jgi:hypothetical protein